jgi:UDP-N-acetylglucosamine:LPS N-acetylglucosamine transferase
MTRPRIVFATIAAGGGHVATARAMAQAVETLAPGEFDLPVSDLMLDLGFAAWDARHKAQWRWMLAHPWSARVSQRMIDALPTATRWALRRALDAVARAAAQRFRADPPALIVANHGFLAFALTRSRRRYGLDSRVWVLTTEPVDASALWAETDVERFMVPSRHVHDDLVRMGVGPDRIHVVGYPVGQAFLHPPPKPEARVRLGLGDRFTCLVAWGGEGVGGRPVAIVDALRAMPGSPQVVVVAGRNAALAATLRARSDERLFVHEFVDDMATHLAACDVVVGKAGGASVMEAIAVGRPTLVPAYAGLNEARTLRFLETNGLGHDTTRPDALRARVAAYLAEPGSLDGVSARCRNLDVTGMTARVGAYVTAAARGEAPPEGTVGKGLA